MDIYLVKEIRNGIVSVIPCSSERVAKEVLKKYPNGLIEKAELVERIVVQNEKNGLLSFIE